MELDQGRIVVDENLQTIFPASMGGRCHRWLAAGPCGLCRGICAAEQPWDRKAGWTTGSFPGASSACRNMRPWGSRKRKRKTSHQNARFPFKSLGMGQAMGEPEGLVKIIAHAQTIRSWGPISSDPMPPTYSEIALAMRGGLPSRVIMETIHTHPTLSEAVLEVAQAFHGQAIHMPPGGRMMTISAPEWLITEVRHASGAKRSRCRALRTSCPPRSAHRLRERPLSQPGGMFFPSHCHFPYPGRRLHPGLHLLRREKGETPHWKRMSRGAWLKRCQLGLRHVVITSVTRDDLSDGGAAILPEWWKPCDSVAPMSASSFWCRILPG